MAQQGRDGLRPKSSRANYDPSVTTPDSDGPRSAELQERIDKLEHQHSIDQRVIRHLEDEGILTRDKVENLEAALITCRRIGAAMGILMCSEKVTDEQAFDLLRKKSHAVHRKVREVAEDVILTGTLD